jgi:amino acid adenylation domain-containing protein
MPRSQIQDMYELSPLQHGMLFHTLYEPASHLYFEQVVIPFQGALHRRAFEAAWQDVVDQNDVLRTSFHWEEIEKPIQVVHAAAAVPVADVNLERLAPTAQLAEVERFLARDRAEGARLDQAPLLRVTLLRLSPIDHRLVFSFHHIILDGWSLQLIFRQFSVAYQARIRGQRPDLPPTRRYRDYISWLQHQDLAGAQAFWRRTLAGFEGLQPIWGRSHGQEPIPEFGDHELVLPASTSTALAAASARHRLTVNTLAQGAWAIVLSGLTGSDDVVFGVTVSGRPVDLAGVEAMVGLFINTIPLRARLPEREPLPTWLRRIQEQQVEARQYEFTPLVHIQQWSEVPRGAALFNTMLAFENYPVKADTGTATKSLVTFAERTNYPLSVVVVPGDPVRVRLLHDRRHFDVAAVELIAGRFGQLLDDFGRDLSRRVTDLPWGGDKDQRLIRRINDTRTDYPSRTTVHQLFEERTAASPSAIAFESGERRWTYEELDRLANALSRRLRAHQVGAETPVVLLMDRSPELVLAMLATLKAGGAYIPLDPANPPDRLQAIVTDTNAEVVLTSQTYAVEAQALSMETIVVDADPVPAVSQGSLSEGSEDPAAPGHPDQLAYVMYTSGSTGQPKGIGITHRAVVRLVRHTDYLQLNASDRVGHLSSGAFDAATFEIWGPLLNGGRVVLIERDTALSPDALAAELEAHAITVLFVTTALLNRVASERPHAFGRLRCLLFGGEAVDPRWVARVLKADPPVRLLHVYGPTESTTFATCYHVAAVPPGAGSIPIGKPIANTRAYLLDRYLRPVPRGGVGELYLGGDGLARGYLGDPRRTAERFLPDPSGVQPGARLYRTGDRMRFLSEGQLEFLGRLDDQVKLRGYRIELGEVMYVLESHPDVRESLALLQTSRDGEKRLVAYVAADKDTHDALRVELDQLMTHRLPQYMRPSVLMILPALPLNVNGKIDRRALPPPDAAHTHRRQASSAPTGPVEERLAEILCDVLGLDSVGIHDNFFELGAHSLMATKLISRIRREFGVELELRAVFETPTVAQLSRRVGSVGQTPMTTPAGIPRVPREARRQRMDPAPVPSNEDAT